jgi:hypothetical protein
LRLLENALVLRAQDRDGHPVWLPRDSVLRAASLVLWIVWFACTIPPVVLNVRKMMSSGSPLGALVEYTYYIQQFWAGQPIYVPHDLHGFHYLPATLILVTPLTWLGLPATGATVGLLSVAAMTASVCYLCRVLFGSRALIIAGVILGLSAMPATTSLQLVQFQIFMTASVIAASAAAARGRYWEMSLWLILGIAIKPLGTVLALLAACLFPRCRLPLIVAVIVLVLLPYAFQDAGYVTGEYANYVGQLWHISEAPPMEWANQADFPVFWEHFGVDLGAGTRMVIRLGAVLATLIAAIRLASWRSAKATGFGLLILSVTFIALFNPKQEQYSFIVVAPALAALTMLLLLRNAFDWLGWLWLAFTICIGLRLATGQRWILPGLMLVIWLCLLWLISNRSRWLALFQTMPGRSEAPPDIEIAGKEKPRRSGVSLREEQA